MIEIHSELTQHLKELHLPTFRECYQSEADLGRQESLTHEQYLLELAKKECDERAHKRTVRYLRESKLPLEKNIDVFDRKRLPAKINSLVTFLLKAHFLTGMKMYWLLATPAAARLIYYALLGRN